MYQSEYQAWLRRERRRELLTRLTGCAVMIASAVLMAGGLYLALVGFLFLFGGE